MATDAYDECLPTLIMKKWENVTLVNSILYFHSNWKTLENLRTNFDLNLI